MATRIRITADEYLSMEDPFETRRSELIDGEIVWSQPTLWHQRASMEIAAALLAWEKATPGRGLVSIPLDVKLDEFNVYGPDVLWYAQGRAPRIEDPRPYPMPDLVVEVRSPSTWRYDVGRKKAGYEAFGARELWLVDSASVLVYRRSDLAKPVFDVELELAPPETLRSPLLPGFALPLAGLYPVP